MSGVGGGMVGSMMAPPGEKSKGFALGATLGMGSRVALANPKVRNLIGADEMAENMGKGKKAKTDADASTTKSAPNSSTDPETKAQTSSTKKFRRKGPEGPTFGPDGKIIEYVKRPKKRFVPKNPNSI